MRGILSLFVILPLTGCLLEASKGRASTTVVRDTSVPGIDRTSSTSEYTGTAFGASVPIMMTDGYGYGQRPIVARPSCRLHPDECADIREMIVVQPVTFVSNGNDERGRGSDNGAEIASDPELNALLTKHGAAIAALAGQGKQTVRQACHNFLVNVKANPTVVKEVIKDPAEVQEVVSTCEAYLAKHTYNAKKEEK